jgi:hypothetical protein
MPKPIKIKKIRNKKSLEGVLQSLEIKARGG